MSHATRWGRLLTGLGAAAGAVATAALMSAAGTPTARADDFSDIINVVDEDLATGQADVTAAFSYFADAQPVQGIAALLSSLNMDSVSTSDNFLAGSVALLTNGTVPNELDLSVADPGTFAGAVTVAQLDISIAQTIAGGLPDLLARGDYTTFTFDSLIASDFAGLLPADVLLLGGLDSLGI